MKELVRHKSLNTNTETETQSLVMKDCVSRHKKGGYFVPSLEEKDRLLITLLFLVTGWVPDHGSASTGKTENMSFQDTSFPAMDVDITA